MADEAMGILECRVDVHSPRLVFTDIHVPGFEVGWKLAHWFSPILVFALSFLFYSFPSSSPGLFPLSVLYFVLTWCCFLFECLPVLGLIFSPSSCFFFLVQLFPCLPLM